MKWNEMKTNYSFGSVKNLKHQTSTIDVIQNANFSVIYILYFYKDWNGNKNQRCIITMKTMSYNVLLTY